MILPLTNTPTEHDLPRPRAALPVRFKATDPDGRELHCVGCPLCGCPVEVSEVEYNAGVEPICTDCEQTHAHLES